ncbi:MAG: RDD family protein, partial [Bacteroidales bacterium]|nr:RDD family protein [Bacteroidales bacterium]
MAFTSHIVTGQFVRINQAPASLGERMAAQFIDWVIEFVWVFAMIWLMTELEKIIFNNTIFLILYLILLFVPVIFYSLLWELFNHGQTPGKRLMKLRVVNVDGSSPSLG